MVSPSMELGHSGVRLAYDTVSESYAGRFLDVSAESPLELAMVDAFAEAVSARVLRPGGHLLIAFQSGEGTRDVSAAYRRVGHDVVLERYLFTPDVVASHLADAGLTELTRMVRRARDDERDDQAVLLARATPAVGGSV
ncbi:MAG: hypothetical protein ABIN90_04480 [Knoellia sp.]